MNLLSETVSVLHKHGKTFGDVKWIGTSGFTISKDNFISVADREYDNGFGAPEVATDLVIVGDDWWLERFEYDGAESWEFKTKPCEPNESRTVSTVIVGDDDFGDSELAELSANKALWGTK